MHLRKTVLPAPLDPMIRLHSPGVKLGRDALEHVLVAEALDNVADLDHSRR